MNRFLCLFLALVGSVALHAQATVPALKGAEGMPARTLVVGGPELSIHLGDYFTLTGVTGSLVQFDTIKGKYNVELFANDTPKTVANFLGYVDRGDYNNSIVHRAEAGFVIQGGYLKLTGSDLGRITTAGTVQNEPHFSNTRGTLAMAKQPNAPDSASSQWFVNLNNNSASLDGTNGGYTVFGRVLGTGMTIVDSIAGIPIYDKSAALGDTGLTQMPLLNDGSLVVGNLALVNSVRRIPMFPQLGNSSSAVSVSATFAAAGVVSGETSADTLTLRPVAAGSTTVTVRVVDTNNNAVEASFPVTVVASPVITAQPEGKSIDAGGNSTLSVAATAGATYQWQYNGATIANLAVATVNVNNMQPSLAGLYNAVVTNGSAVIASKPAILGVSTSSKVLAGASEVGANITHPNGNHYDQVLLQASSSAFTADWTIGDVTRLSYIDLQDDIVQVEYAGPGTVSIVLDSATGPAAPVKYEQSSVSYWRGHATIVVTGADERSNLSVFSVGKANAFDPTGTYDFLQPISSTNNPENNGNPLFAGHATSSYDGFADLARICIISTNGKFGGLRAANARFYDIKGYTGIYAPGVTFEGPVFVGDIAAFTTATPCIILGSASDTRVTGGDLFQPNGQPVEISGVTQLKFTAGGSSAGGSVAAHLNEGILHQNGTNVTTQVVAYPQ